LPDGRLSVADATAAVRAWMFKGDPNMNPSAEFPLEEITTAEIWERLHVQVFRITDGIYGDQDCLIQDRRVSALGIGLGGFGVTSMCVADLAGDGGAELVFSYSWGSGVHRSLVGVWAVGSPRVDAPEVLWNDEDLSLVKVDDRHVRVEYGRFDGATRRVTPVCRFGDLVYTKEPGKTGVSIRLCPDLPPKVVKRIWHAPATTALEGVDAPGKPGG